MEFDGSGMAAILTADSLTREACASRIRTGQESTGFRGPDVAPCFTVVPDKRAPASVDPGSTVLRVKGRLLLSKAGRT